MLHRLPSLIIAIIASVAVLALAQAGGAVAGSAGAGTGTGTGSANTSGSAPSGMGTNASSANPGPSAPPGIGTRDVGTGANLNRTSQTNSPDVQPTTSKSRAAARPRELPALATLKMVCRSELLAPARATRSR